MSKAELQELARQHGLSEDGTNDEIRSRLTVSLKKDGDIVEDAGIEFGTGVRAESNAGASTLVEKIAQEEQKIRLLQLTRQRRQLEEEEQRHRPTGESQKMREAAVACANDDESESSSDEEVDVDWLLERKETGRRRKQTERNLLLVRDFVDRPEQEEVIANGLGGRITVKGRAVDAGDITPGDWIIGNCRVMLALIRNESLVSIRRDGKLDTKNLEAYLQYSISIGELMKRGFRQRQINAYDEDYRRFQHDTQCKWGKSSLRLVTKHLVPTEPTRMSSDSLHSDRSGNKSGSVQAQKPFQRKPVTTPGGEEICLYYNRRGCSRRICRFKHVCTICYGEHSAAFHPGPKN
jgi:hypothetical protein